MPAVRRDVVTAAIARVSGPAGQTVGVGVLVSRDRVLTSAAVAEAASDEPAGGGPVTVEFPLVGSAHSATATVLPSAPGSTILELSEPAPSSAGPAPLYRPATFDGRRVRVFGFPPGRRDGVWLAGRMVERAGGAPWLVTEGPATSLTTGYGGSAVWDDELGAVVAITVAATPDGSAVLLPIDEAFAVDPFTLPCPYPGVEPFDERDETLFHGRDDDVGRVEVALRTGPLVAVAGRSGTGKSSLVRAGLAPRLRANGTAVAVFRAGPPDPFNELAAALAGLVLPDGTADDRIRETRHLLRALADGGVADLAERLERRDTVIIADQFEDLALTDPGTAHRLLLTLAGLANAAQQRVRVVLTTRWDAMDDLLRAEAGGLADYALVSIGPIGRDQLRSAIVRPAERPPGLAFEDGLVERILDDSVDEPGQLPLVASLLTELWEHRTGGTIRAADYDRLGGVRQAFARRAERAIDSLDDPVGARSLLIRLTRPVDGDADIRRPVPMAELTPTQREIAEQLVRSRVLVAGPGVAGQQTVELAHQALIDLWPRLRTWLAEDREFRSWHENIERQRLDWEASGADPGRLLRGSALLHAESRLRGRDADISAPNRDFVRTSRARRRRELWSRRGILAGVAAAAVAAVTLTALFLVQRDVAREQEAAAASRALAVESADVARTEPAQSLELALAAYRTDANPETEQALFSRYLDGRATVSRAGEWRLTPGGSHVVRVVDDGHRLETAAVEDLGGTVASVPRRDSRFQDPATMCLCMDGSLLADRLVDGTVEVRTLPDLTLVGTVAGPALVDFDAGIGADLHDGLVVVTDGPRAQWWDPRTGARVGDLDLVELGVADPDDPVRIVPHPDADLVAVLALDAGELSVLDRATGEPLERIEVGDGILVTRFYDDGGYFGLFRRGSVPELWRTSSESRTLGPLPSVAPRCGAGRVGAFECSPIHVGFVWEFLAEREQVLFGDRGRLTWHGAATGNALRVLDLDGRQPVGVSADGATLLFWEPSGEYGIARLSPEHWLACVDPSRHEDAGATC